MTTYPQHSDSDYTLLWRIATALNAGPKYMDTNNALLRKIAIAVTGGLGGGTNSGVLFTNGHPNGQITADPRSLALDPNARKFYVKLTGVGNTGWQEMLGF